MLNLTMILTETKRPQTRPATATENAEWAAVVPAGCPASDIDWYIHREWMARGAVMPMPKADWSTESRRSYNAAG